MKGLFLSAVAMSIVMIGHARADSIPYPFPGFEAPPQAFFASSTGELIAYNYGDTGAYDETLGVEINGIASPVSLYNKSGQGTSADFGQVTAGSNLTFFINVQQTGDLFYSNPLRNSDSANHVYATSYSGGVVGIPAGTYVGFEDLPASGTDFNYQDTTFVFNNVVGVSVIPLPASLPMFSAAILGLLGLSYVSRRKREARVLP